MESEIVVVEEWSGTSSNKLSLTAVISPSTSPSHFTVKSHGSRFNLFSTRFLEAFVPEGFPSSVTPDYIPFQTWDLLQGLSTYIRMMLSTQALLSAIGVGEKSATVIGATFQWFLRDLTGMLGGVMFTFYQGSNLDSNAKMWRLVADLMNDLGMLMDLLSPLFPSAFVFIVCIGSLSRSFTGVASGATRAALTQHFALQNNAADISAKEGSQETVATMIGMALGMFLAQITMGHSTIIWFSFLSLTMFHMYANYKAVRCLNLTTLNCERGSILLRHFMETGQVLSPKEVSVSEHVLPLWISSWGSKNSKFLDTRVRLGVRVSSLNSLETMELLCSAGSRYEKAKYVLLEKKGIVSIVMHKDSTTGDVMCGFIHALVMANLFYSKPTSLHTDSQSWMDKHYESFLLKLQSSGWKTERLLSSSIIWRANWIRRVPDKKIN
ncbi:protein root UVB sensitive 3 [Tanacetum coccineum]